MNPSTIIPEEVIGFTVCNGQLMVSLKSKGHEEADIIAAEDAYVLWPELILKFYEKKLTWHEGKRKSSTLTSRRPLDATKLKKRRKRLTSKYSLKSGKKNENEDGENDIDEKVPERILGATNASGQLKFLLKWEGVNEVDLIKANEAYRRCPQLLLKWYEERIAWKASN